MHVARGKDAKFSPGGPPVFTGDVNRGTLSDASSASRLFMGLVKFSPGARTVWHSHTFEQGLVIIEGKGIVATEAQEHVVEPGDVVIVPEGEKHWHGGTNTTGMAHVAVNGPGETKTFETVDKIKTPGV